MDRLYLHSPLAFGFMAYAILVGGGLFGHSGELLSNARD